MFQHPAIKTALVATFCLTWLGCAKPHPSQSGAGQNACEIAIYAAPKALSPKGGSADKQAAKALKREIASKTDLVVTLLPAKRQKNSKQVRLLAAAESANWALNLYHPTGVPNGFVSGTLSQVTQGKTQRSIALPRDNAKTIRGELVGWLTTTLSSATKCPAFDPMAFAQRLAQEKRCGEVVEYLNDYAYASAEEGKQGKELLRRCRQSELIKDSARGRGSRNLIRMKLENVPAYQYPRFKEVAERPFLNRAVGDVSRQFSDLSIGCDSDCLVGRMDLTVQFNLDWYRAHLKDAKKPYEPYRALAKAFLRFRKEVSLKAGLPSMKKFPLALHLLDVGGQELILKVTGSERSPKMDSEIDPKPFLFPEL